MGSGRRELGRRYHTFLRGFTAVPRPLDGRPPFVWHGSIRSPEIVEQAARYGDGFFASNLFMPMDYFARYVGRYRVRYADHGHGRAEDAPVGAGGAVFVRPRSQDALREFEPYFRATPHCRGADLADVVALTGLTVGSPAQVVDKVLATRERFGDYLGQLFGLEHSGLPEGVVHEMIDLLGAEVLPALRAESHPVAG